MVRPSPAPARRTVLPGTVLASLGSLGARVANWPRKALAALVFATLIVVGLVDYFTGYEISVLIFYLLPVSLAAWFVNRRFSFLMSSLSVGTWIAADVGAGATYANKIVFGWNATIILGFFLVVAFLLDSLRTSLRELESRVRQRTVALTEEIAERARLEIEVLEISEREQRRIGHDLHDSLGQHLTAAALAGQVLGDHLTALQLDAEVAEAERLVGMIEESIELTRGLARGLSPVTLETEGLTDALTELADTTTAQFYLLCRLQSEGSVQIDDPIVAMHLYRIAQEAISNAVRHGCASQIHIVLAQQGARQLTLSIEDDGRGLPPPAEHRAEGQGLRIMKHRATMIGAELEILPAQEHGTIVRCVLDLTGQRSAHPSKT